LLGGDCARTKAPVNAACSNSLEALRLRFAACTLSATVDLPTGSGRSTS
jgi:hypothetical protein